MGVHGLNTFLENNCNGVACYPVNITECAKNFRLITNTQPVIVVDSQSCLFLWYKGLNWVTGYEIQELIDRLRKFVEEFEKNNIKLIFFFAGMTVKIKREAWLSRTRKKLNKFYYFFVKTISSQTDFLYEDNIPTCMGFTVLLILKYILKCEVYCTIDECDEEIVKYANHHKCFAIFGQDTDFVIYNTDSVILSSRRFKLSDMTTVLYDRVQLANILKIYVIELPILAILAGNDLISCKYFYNYPFRIRMHAIGNYIRTLSNLSIDEKLEKISIDQLNDHSKLELLKSIYINYTMTAASSLKENEPVKEWDKILVLGRFRHRNIISPGSVYSVLSEQTYAISATFEDLQNISNTNTNRTNIPSSIILRPLRQRSYGILLYEHEKFPNICVEEYVGENSSSYIVPEVVHPIAPIVHHPGLLILWGDDNSEECKEIKWKLFLSSISPKIKNYEEWSMLSKDFLIPTIILYYLKEANCLIEWEINAVLASFVTFPSYSATKIKDILIPPENLDRRAIHLSITITRAFMTVVFLLNACGNPIQMSEETALLKFEGKLFHSKYLAAKEQNCENLCENNEEYLKTFNEIKNFIFKSHDDGSLSE